MCFFVAFIVLSFTLSFLWNEPDYHGESLFKISLQRGSILPFDLSVNHLQRIELAGGALPEQRAAAEEDFLPIIAGGTRPELRFRLKPAVGASPSAIKDISAYQVIAENAHDSTVLWDSGKMPVNGMPHSIPWDGDSLQVGTIVKWRVSVWDSKGEGPSTSQWTRFGVGPETWTGQWITHPTDSSSYKNTSTNVWDYDISEQKCNEWKARRPLPIARAKVELSKQEASRKVVSALLVVSGLGSFATTFNGMPLSSSSVLDPPMTDFSQRVSYRGFDVTSHFQNSKQSSHVVGIALGSGWWDGRPLKGGLIKFNFLPQGPLTTIAELHLTFSDGSNSVKIPSGTQDWQMAKGFIRDSDLFTGDTIDLGTMQAMSGWDSPKGWNTVRGSKNSDVAWMEPVLYESDITLKEWRRALSERAGANNREEDKRFSAAPIGKLVPIETLPVMPIERIAPESVVSLGDGRWLLDFGKAMSGFVRFDNGLPDPIVPKNGYPRSHLIDTDGDEKFITIVYGESIQMETGDINLILVAGMGLHDGGIRQQSRGPNYDTQKAGGPCFPRDHGMILTQRDAFFIHTQSSGSFSDARQPLFTSHGFRFAEVCCTKETPKNVHALAYRTAFPEWGKFDSSNVLLNGAYELTRNALNSNMLGTQTDCPHRERLQYGGDLVADSPAALHFFDLSAFYTKVIHDWTDTQWNNGAYTETSIWQDLNDYAGIGHGAGETVWASLPPVLTVRHMQHYADVILAEDTFEHHVKWLHFLISNWEAGISKLIEDKYGKELNGYYGGDGGLGDWLALTSRDTWLTHHAYFMATARSIGYLAKRLGGKDGQGAVALELADEIKKKINALYMKRDTFRLSPNVDWTPGPEMGLFARIVPGSKRCAVLREYIRLVGSEDPVLWPGDEERLFFRHLNKYDFDEMLKLDKVRKDGKNNKGEERFDIVWRRRHHMPEGILAVRYSLKALSDSGFHNIALTKATGEGFPGFEYMLSHNATTMWESWWRSEDLYSRNHPMLGAVAEWASSSVAGVSLAPTTIGGQELLFWPRIPTSAVVVQFASATQGTKRGDASIAWEFLDLPKDKRSYDSAVVKVHMRVLVPPGSKATLRLPTFGISEGGEITIKYAEQMPDLEKAKSSAASECGERRKAGKGFHYNWEYDRTKEEWSKVYNGKAIGTPCKSYLFGASVNQIQWSLSEPVINTEATGSDDESENGTEIDLRPGLYDLVINKWQLVKTIEDTKGYRAFSGDLGQYCSDPDTYSWDVNDATHLI